MEARARPPHTPRIGTPNATPQAQHDAGDPCDGGGLSVFAASAQAVVVDNDPASLTGNAEVQLTDANLAFDFSNGR